MPAVARNCPTSSVFSEHTPRIGRSQTDTVSEHLSDMFHGRNNGDGNGALGANLMYSKFLFVTLGRDDAKARARIREAGACIGRGFFNEFHGDGTPNKRSNETIQFLVAPTLRRCNDGLLSAGYVAHVTTKYRPRLDEIQAELVRRLGNVASVRAIDGALQTPRYTSAALHEYAYGSAAERQSGCAAANVIIIPMSKTAAWWEMSTLERHAYFYPHVDQQSGGPVARTKALMKAPSTSSATVCGSKPAFSRKALASAAR